MHGWKCFALAVSLVTLSACSGKSLLQADCHSCAEEEQRWEDFSFSALSGTWRGTIETWTHDYKTKKQKDEKRVEFRFVESNSFLNAKGVASCTGLPKDSVVLNGVLWESGSNAKEFEAFAKTEDGLVSYGRIGFEKLNGSEVCRFKRLGRVMGRNRLALPAARFSQRGIGGRSPASGPAPEFDVNVEFLRFDVASVKPVEFRKDGRRPAALALEERPTLLIRVYKSVKQDATGKKPAVPSTVEHLYRLWKAN